MIKNIKIENLKAISSLEHSFDGGVYFIKGENDLGKSTILNILDGLLSGNTNKHELLKQGEQSGKVEIETDDHIISCKFSKSNPKGSIVLTDKKQGFATTKKSILQEIFGYNSFDAEMFVRWSETAEGRRKQIETIKSLYPVETIKRLNEIESNITMIKDSRKPINQDLEKFNSLIEEIEVDPNINHSVNISELIKSRDEIITCNNKINKAKEAKLDFKNKINQLELSSRDIQDDADRGIEALRIKIAQIEEKTKIKVEANQDQIIKIQNRIKDADAYLEGKEVKSTDELDEKIENAESINSQLDKNIRAEYYTQSYKDAKKKKEDMEQNIEDLLTEKSLLLEENNPIKGLSFDSEKLYFDGIAFDNRNISDSQKLLIGFQIQVKKNPKSKIFLISRGESIGKKKMDLILDFANKYGYQGFIEKFEFDQEDLRIEKYEVS